MASIFDTDSRGRVAQATQEGMHDRACCNETTNEYIH